MSIKILLDMLDRLTDFIKMIKTFYTRLRQIYTNAGRSQEPRARHTGAIQSMPPLHVTGSD